MKFIHAVYLGRRPSVYDNIKEAPVNQIISTGIFTLLCLFFGIGAAGVLEYLIYPVVTGMGYQIPVFTGFFDPVLLSLLFLAAFFAGYLIYLFVRKIRYDDLYLGGMAPSPEYSISGTEFYREVRNFKFIKNIYNAAEKELFDLYEVSREFTLKVSKGFQAIHSGQLQVYILFIVIGTLLLFILL